MATDETLAKFAERVRRAKTSRRGVLAFRLSGKGGGNFFIDLSVAGERIVAGDAPSSPLLEIEGEAERVSAVLDGRKSWLSQLYGGGLTVRGDLKFINELASDLGIIG